VIVDAVEAAPLGVKGTQPRRVLIGLAPELGRAALPVILPKAARFSVASAAPSRATASRKGVSDVNRFTSVKAGL
jgi:hypothetical protein